MIVNAGGKNIYPGPIEDMFKTSKWIDQMVVVGEAQNFMAGLIVPDFEILAKYAKDNGLEYKTNEVLISHPEVNELFKKEIRAFSKIWLLMRRSVISDYYPMNLQWKQERSLQP